MRRALGMVPLAPIALAAAVLGCDALARDVMARGRRFWAELQDEIEGNK